MAVVQSAKSKLWLCKICLKDCIARNPDETPLSLRPKIRMELYTLAELQRLCIEKDFLFQECTSWDCQVLSDGDSKSLGFRPDMLWLFDEQNQLISNFGPDNIISAFPTVSYALVLEINEVSRAHHSTKRSVPDEDRESQMREFFNSLGINMGLIYFTVAHNRQHLLKAHRDDIFFQKNNDNPKEEPVYEIIPEKLEAWQTRITQCCEAFLDFVETRSNTTVCFGH